jgi:hypothetical protein
VGVKRSLGARASSSKDDWQLVPDKEFPERSFLMVTKWPNAQSQKKIPAVPADLCVSERRANERRANGRSKRQPPAAAERAGGKPSREERGQRRSRIDPTTCERDYTNDEIEFMKAMDQYKRENRRPFPTWSEVLEVLHAIGYRKAAKPTPMPGLSTTMPPKGTA